jgi:hypothetical protein
MTCGKPSFLIGMGVLMLPLEVLAGRKWQVICYVLNNQAAY